MNLLSELKAIKNLDGKTTIRLICVDDTVIQGFYRGYISALNNEPEISQLDIEKEKSGDLVGVLENEIKSIEAI